MPSFVPPKLFEWNILPISQTGSIFCRDFRLSPPMFSVFYKQTGRGGQRYPLSNRPNAALRPLDPIGRLSRLGAAVEVDLRRRFRAMPYYAVSGARCFPAIQGQYA